MKKRVSIIIVALIIMCIPPLSAFASTADMIDVMRECSLTMKVEHGGVSIEGAQVSLYHVADLVKNGTHVDFEYTTGFSGIDADPWSIETVDDNTLLAKKFLAHASDQDLVPKDEHIQDTNTDGHVYFSNLKAGLYLIVHDSIPGYVDMHPYLVILPVLANGREWTHDVVARPKTQLIAMPPIVTVTVTPTITPTETPIKTPTVTPTFAPSKTPTVTPIKTPTGTPRKKITATPKKPNSGKAGRVKTGDSSMDIAMLLSLSCLSLSVVAGALIYKRKRINKR